MSDELGQVFAALSDPTRRAMIEALLREGTTSVPRLTAELPISRQAVAKHLTALRAADLVKADRVGRETLYSLQPEPLETATKWIATVGAEWDGRLAKLKRALDRQ